MAESSKKQTHFLIIPTRNGGDFQVISVRHQPDKLTFLGANPSSAAMPKPVRQICFPISDENYKKLISFCMKKEISTKEFLTEIMEAYLNKRKPTIWPSK